jgi:Rhamnan synthesis protein F/Methyltransferase domain
VQNSDFGLLTSPDLEPVFWTPERLGRASAWWGHVPFAFWLVAKSQPRLLVELGTHYGVSYAAFCEAVSRLRLGTRCYAVDTWTGDPHTSNYGEDVYGELKDFHDKRYASFSQLVRKTFDAAHDDFADGTIDLLHIDGFHTYDAVRHDFDTWRSKLSDQGVVLFHDTNERQQDFGVWRLFQELKAEALTFEFLHSHGLGIVAVGRQAPEAIHKLCTLTEGIEIAAIRERFSLFGARWRAAQETNDLANRALEDIIAQRNTHTRALEGVVAEKDAQARALEGAIVEKDTRARTLEDVVAEKDADARALENAVAEKDARARALEDAIAEKDARARALEDAIAEKDAHARSLEDDIAEKDAHARSLEDAITEKDAHARALENAVAEKDARVRALEGVIAQKNSRIAETQSAIAVAQRQKSDLAQRAQRIEQAVHKTRAENYALRDAIRQNSEDEIRRLAVLKRIDYNGKLPRRLRGLSWLIPSRRRKLRELARDYRLIAPSPLFDSSWYLETNRDVAAKTEDAVLHYLLYGAREKRAPSSIFDTGGYLAANPDVDRSGVNPLVHYLLYGRSEARLHGSKQTAEAVQGASGPFQRREDNVGGAAEGTDIPDGSRTDESGGLAASPNGFDGNEPWELPEFVALRKSKPRGFIAVVVHIYHVDIWPEISDAIRNIEEPFDLFITLVLGSADSLAEDIRSAWPFSHVIVVDNRGRDVLPFVSLLQTGVLFRYELMCKVHTKRSLWHEDGNTWRRQLVGGILGSRSQVRSILRSFRADPDLGLVVADGHLYSGRFLWAQNKVHLARLFAHFGMDEREFDRSFAGGNMFWVRPSLLRAICGLALRVEDFEPEPLGQDGCLAHALERLFSLLCYEAGMSIKETSALPPPELGLARTAPQLVAS